MSGISPLGWGIAIFCVGIGMSGALVSLWRGRSAGAVLGWALFGTLIPLVVILLLLS